MDPQANLARQLELAILLQTMTGGEQDKDDLEDLAATAAELAQLVLDLDTWRRTGGFDPYAAAPPTL